MKKREFLSVAALAGLALPGASQAQTGGKAVACGRGGGSVSVWAVAAPRVRPSPAAAADSSGGSSWRFSMTVCPVCSP